MDIQFSDIKLIGQEIPELGYKKKNGKLTSTISGEKFDQPAHADFIQAMEKLKPHFALICEQLQENDINWMNLQSENLLPFTVNGFHLKDNKVAGVVIVGSKKLSNEKVLGLNSPYVKLEDESEKAYPFLKELNQILKEVAKEADAYLMDGKFAKDPQSSMFDADGQPITHAQVLPATFAEFGPAEEADKPLKKKGRPAGKKKQPVTVED